MKLSVGMYVRTKYGHIAKLIYIDYEDEYYEFDKGIVWFYEYLKDMFNFEDEDLKQITKASHNIIDLIEVGDYVNDLKVTSVDKTFEGNKLIGLGKNFGFSKFDNDYKITSVVTHEQMEQMAYKVG